MVSLKTQLISQESKSEANVINENCCKLCNKTFSNSYNPISWFTTESRKCFVCEELICIECCSGDEKYYTETKMKGYVCKKCDDKTRISLTMPFVDLNPVYDLLENQLPNLLDKTNSTIDSKLNEIKIVIEEQREKIKQDIVLIVNETINNQLYPKLLKIILVSFLGIFVLSGLITLEVLSIIKNFNY